MSEVFVSYARSTERQAHRIADALRALGYDVWRDDQLPAHRSYGEVIEERLKAAKAVVVVWSLEAIGSQWVRAEADRAREAGTLVQLTVDGSLPPIPFNQIQCADLRGWDGESDAPGWQKIEASIAALTGGPGAAVASTKADEQTSQKVSICVLPFENMSGDPEQEYFSDGISEDIITDLSKISSLSVIARNTAFRFKGKEIDVKAVATELGVSHVLEGSVRKSGTRVRITAQLIDGRAGDHVWAERYDRELTDIFEIQDEISKAIADALKLRLLPKEKKAIEQRGTHSADAYNLYLMAREHWITGSYGDARRAEMVIRICSQATALDPSYGRAWALMALAQTELRFWHGRAEDGLPTAERALALDPNIAEAHCIRARYLTEDGRFDEANAHIETALRLDPDSWEANHDAAMLIFRQGRINDAVPYFEKAASLMDTDYHSQLMLNCCYEADGDNKAGRRAAQLTIERAEKVVAKDPMNGGALTAGGSALAALGDMDRAREWIDRAMLVAPDDLRARYNLACALSAQVHDPDGALKLLGPYFENVPTLTQVKHADVDPDLNPLRNDPRFQKMVADAKARLGMAGEAIAAQ
ncbi:MAG TPA: TIR domain-containing protein [Sphingomicrobium sp.]|jgi:adenylate cyclase|nr:TIR domain-containing protein [Sphingomicrobium sp.]